MYCEERSYDVDALECPACGGRLKFIDVVTDPSQAREVLDDLGLPSAAPDVSPPRAADADLDLYQPGPTDWDP